MAALTGASGTIDWSRSTKYNHIGLFCQFMSTAALSSGSVAILEVTHSNNVFRIGVSVNSVNQVWGYIKNNADTAEIRKGAATYHEPTNGTWYDLGFTYDAITEKSYLYFAESGDASFTNFLDGETSLDEGIGEENNTDCTVQDIPWTGCNMLKEIAADSIAAGEDLYLQNAFVFDGRITSHSFNTLRRLVFLWNKKLTQYPK